MININLLKKGDEVLSLNEKFLAVKRTDGTVDVYNVFFNEEGIYVDPIKTATIGYGEGTVEKMLDDGETRIVSF